MTNSAFHQSASPASSQSIAPPASDLASIPSLLNLSHTLTSLQTLETKSRFLKQRLMTMVESGQVITLPGQAQDALALASVSSELEVIFKTLKRASEAYSLLIKDLSSPSATPRAESPLPSEPSNGISSPIPDTWTPAKQETLIRLLLEYVGLTCHGAEAYRRIKLLQKLPTTDITLTDLCVRSSDTDQIMGVSLRLSPTNPDSPSTSSNNSSPDTSGLFPAT